MENLLNSFQQLINILNSLSKINKENKLRLLSKVDSVYGQFKSVKDKYFNLHHELYYEFKKVEYVNVKFLIDDFKRKRGEFILDRNEVLGFNNASYSEKDIQELGELLDEFANLIYLFFHSYNLNDFEDPEAIYRLNSKEFHMLIKYIRTTNMGKTLLKPLFLSFHLFKSPLLASNLTAILNQIEKEYSGFGEGYLEFRMNETLKPRILDIIEDSIAQMENNQLRVSSAYQAIRTRLL